MTTVPSVPQDDPLVPAGPDKMATLTATGGHDQDASSPAVSPTQKSSVLSPTQKSSVLSPTQASSSEESLAKKKKKLDEFLTMLRNTQDDEQDFESHYDDSYESEFYDKNVRWRLKYLTKLLFKSEDYPIEKHPLNWWIPDIGVNYLIDIFNYENDEVLEVWNKPKIAEFRHKLIEKFHSELDFDKKRQLAELVLYVANLTDWPEITAFLEECIASNESRKEESGMLIYAQFIKEGRFGDTSDLLIPSLVPLIKKGILHEDSGLRRAALTLFIVISQLKVEMVTNIVPLEVLIQIGSKKCDGVDGCTKDHRDVVDCINSLLLHWTEFPKSAVPRVLDFIYKRIHGEHGLCRNQFERHKAAGCLPLLVKICANEIKDEDISRLIATSLIAYEDELPSDEIWLKNADIDDEYYAPSLILMHYSYNGFHAENRGCNDEVIMCIIENFGNERVDLSPHIKKTMKDMVKDDKWRFRAAAARALVEWHYFLQGKLRLSDAVDCITPFLTDMHFRVREQACDSLSRIISESEEREEVLHSAQIETILPALREVLADPNPRMANSAFGAFCNSGIPQEVLAKNYDELVVIVLSWMKKYDERNDSFDALWITRIFPYAFYLLSQLAVAVGKDIFMKNFDEVIAAISECKLNASFTYVAKIIIDAGEDLCELIGAEANEPLLKAMIKMVPDWTRREIYEEVTREVDVSDRERRKPMCFWDFADSVIIKGRIVEIMKLEQERERKKAEDRKREEEMKIIEEMRKTSGWGADKSAFVPSDVLLDCPTNDDVFGKDSGTSDWPADKTAFVPFDDDLDCPARTHIYAIDDDGIFGMTHKGRCDSRCTPGAVEATSSLSDEK